MVCDWKFGFFRECKRCSDTDLNKAWDCGNLIWRWENRRPSHWAWHFRRFEFGSSDIHSPPCFVLSFPGIGAQTEQHCSYSWGCCPASGTKQIQEPRQGQSSGQAAEGEARRGETPWQWNSDFSSALDGGRFVQSTHWGTFPTLKFWGHM